MSWLSSFLHPERGYQAGQEQLDKFYNQAQNFYNQGQANLAPYNQQGQSQYANLNNYIQNLMNPQALQDKWASGYKESEAAKNLEDIAQQHGLNAASALGLMGSTPALQAIQQGTSQIGAADREQYLKDLMKKYELGAGLSQGIYGTGASAAGQQSQNAMGMGQNAMNMGQNAAQLAYGQENAPGDLLSKGLGGIIGLIGSSLGGPIGSALGAGLSQKMGWSPTGSYNPNRSPWTSGQSPWSMGGR